MVISSAFQCRLPGLLAQVLFVFWIGAVQAQAQSVSTPVGRVGYTTMTSNPNGPCSKPGPGFDNTYSGWYFKDPGGNTHTFSGSSYSIGGKGCRNFPLPAQVSGFTATSSDGLFKITTTGANGVVTLGTLNPLYQVVSILYAPPGDLSSDGFTTSTTNGSTSSFGYSITNATGVTYSGSGSASFGGGVFGLSFGVTTTTVDTTTNSSTDAFQEVFTNATGYSISSEKGNLNTANHSLDEFLIWLNPSITMYLNDEGSQTFNTTFQPLSNGAAALQEDIVEVPAVAMQANASNLTSVPLGVLQPQLIAVPGGTATVPGLAAICRNQAYYPNNCAGDPNGQCGCMPSDFTKILSQDPLLGYNGTGTPYPGTVSPLLADNSGAANCAQPNPSDDCRYVPVPVVPGSPTPIYEKLTGPASSTADNTPNTFTQTDATTTSQTLGTSTGESIGISDSVGIKIGGFGFTNSTSSTFTFTESESTGVINGKSNSQAVSLNSATIGCDENVNIFEDTVFHTFVFQEPAGNTTCP